MSDDIQEPTGGSLFLTVVGVTVLFLVFVGVLYVSYLPNQEQRDATPAFSAAQLEELGKLAPAERAVRERELRWERKTPTPADRKARLQELHEHEQALLTNYSWVGDDRKVVRLPIARAMELVIQEHQQGGAR